jgi:hypothetical protein
MNETLKYLKGFVPKKVPWKKKYIYRYTVERSGQIYRSNNASAALKRTPWYGLKATSLEDAKLQLKRKLGRYADFEVQEAK